MLTAAGVCVCLLAASLGAATETDEELSPEDTDLMDPELNYIEPARPQAESRIESLARKLRMYRLLNAYRAQDASPNVLAGPKWFPSGTILVPPEIDLSLLKRSVMKRTPEAALPKAKGTTKPAMRKGKKEPYLGSFAVCYLKLCLFRPPNYPN